MVRRRTTHWQEGSGWQPLLHSGDFEAWEAVVAGSLGHHRSTLFPGAVPFGARIRTAAVQEFPLLLIQGSGQVELQREQCGHGVLWLPLQGWSHEVINGEEHLAEQGMGLLFRPGDLMRGVTSEQAAGVSILVPGPLLTAQPPFPRLLWRGGAARRLLTAAWQLVETAALQRPGAAFAAEALEDALQQWCQFTAYAAADGGIAAARRRRLVGEACLWMRDHLTERFSVVELAVVLNVSVRNLQYAFQAELGCTPMAQAKRLRLRQLRLLLQDRALRSRSIAELMEAAGLLACGVTAADYRAWCGETPRRTRQLAGCAGAVVAPLMPAGDFAF